MANILIVAQKELLSAPVFKQDKNLLDLYTDLKDNNNVEILFLHREMKDNKEEKEKVETETKKEDLKKKELIAKAKQFCIRDMMKNKLLKKNLNAFINEHKTETVIFMSNYMAKLIMPYIEKLLENLNVICDLRLTNISSFLQQYKNEKEKDEPNFHGIYRDFNIHFIQFLSIQKYTNNIILDEDSDNFLLKTHGINNVIIPAQIKNYVKPDKNIKNKEKENTFDEIVISRNNYSSNIKPEINSKSNEKSNKYIINETKKFNLINDINNVIKNNKTDYIVIHNDKIDFLPNTLELLIGYLSFNDNLTLCSPIIDYSRERNNLKTRFENQKLNNFSNWHEGKPLSFSEFVVIKKKFFNKVGLFDNKFKTFEYALFDFILRLYQIKAFYCTMNDVSVFKPMNVSRQLSLFEDDKKMLCNKWGESLFNMGI